MTKPIASQRPRPEALIMSGLPELSDELIAHRIDIHMQGEPTKDNLRVL
jgi:hypothetical protein